MFENNHIDEFDLQIRSILENGQEEVPAGVWEGVSAGLDKAARGKVISLWFRRAGLSVAAAAAVVAGFIFIDSDSELDIISPASDDMMIAVAEETDIQNEVPQEDNSTTVDISRVSRLACMTSVPESPAPADLFSTESQKETEEIVLPVEQKNDINEAKTDRSSTKEAAKQSEQYASSSWVEEKEPRKRNIRTSIVISGIAGTNSPTETAKATIFRSQALDRAPSTTIVQQVGTEISYGIPVSLGLGAKINFTKRWAVSAGVNYTLLTSKFEGRYISVNEEVVVSEKPANVKNMQHYIGIPVSAYCNIINNDFISFYAHLGGAVEKCVLNKYAIHTSPIIYHTQAVEGVQFSANAGIGVEFMLGKHVGIYIDPSLRYYFKGNQPKSIRTAQPLMFGFEAGFRFNL